MATKIQLKRGLNANFGAVFLSEGEPAFVTDTGKLYVGDGNGKVLINPIDKPEGLVTSNFYTKFKVNEYGQVVSTESLSASDIPNISPSQITGLGTAATLNTGEMAGQIPVLDASGDLPLSVVPLIPHTNVTGLGTASTVNTGTANGEIPVLGSIGQLPLSTIPLIPSTNVTGLGSAATADMGTQSGNVPVLDATGKLSTVVLPPIAITDTFIVSSQTEMLALDAQVGDIAVRTDISKTFILKTEPASILSNWVELATPTDAVLSVNGKTGTVVLSASDISMTGFVIPGTYTPINPADSASLAIGKLAKNFDSFALLDSPSLTGSPTVPTAIASDNSTKIANTAFVQNALATIDGGTF